MMKIYTQLSSHLKQLYWCGVFWLVLWASIFILTLFFATIPESFFVFLVVVLLFAVPVLLLNVLGVIALIQSLKRQRGFFGAVGYVIGGLVFDVLFVLFLFLATVAIFGFT
jgi:hypothetical protein